MSSLSVLTNLSIIPSLLPPDICSSFDTLESNLILYFSQNAFTAALQNSLVEGEGFEPSYSERTDLQSVAFNHSATPPNRTQDYADFHIQCQFKC